MSGKEFSFPGQTYEYDEPCKMSDDDRQREAELEPPDEIELLEAEIAKLRDQLGEALVRENNLLAALRSVIAHWDEFGPEHGFEEIVYRARKALANEEGK